MRLTDPKQLRQILLAGAGGVHPRLDGRKRALDAVIRHSYSEHLVICPYITWILLVCKRKMRYCSESLQVIDFIGLIVFSQQYCVLPAASENCEVFGAYPVRHTTAAGRVRQRIAEWVQREGHGSRKRLADAVRGLYGKSRSPSWITDILDGPDSGGQDLRLRDLDAVAAAMGVPPGDLVRHDDNLYLEVTPSEIRILRFYRALPDVARHHLVGYLDYLYAMQQKVLEAQSAERDARTAEARREREREKKTRLAT